MPASGWFCGPKGRLHSGIFAFLLDMAHLYAVVSTLPAGGACTTAELSVTVLGEPPPSGAEITGHSRVIYSDERNALAEGLVVDQGGQPLAHSTSRYFLFAPGAVAVSCQAGGPVLPVPGGIDHRRQGAGPACAAVSHLADTIAVSLLTPARGPASRCPSPNEIYRSPLSGWRGLTFSEILDLVRIGADGSPHRSRIWRTPEEIRSRQAETLDGCQRAQNRQQVGE